MQSAWRALLQNIKLMPQYQDFGFQLPPRFEAVAQHADEKESNCNHAAIMLRFAGDGQSSGRSGPEVFGSDNSDRGNFRLVASAPGEVMLTINSTLLLQRAPFNDEGPFVELKPNDRENNAFLLKSVKASACK